MSGRIQIGPEIDYLERAFDHQQSTANFPASRISSHYPQHRGSVFSRLGANT